RVQAQADRGSRRLDGRYGARGLPGALCGHRRPGEELGAVTAARAGGRYAAAGIETRAPPRQCRRCDHPRTWSGLVPVAFRARTGVGLDRRTCRPRRSRERRVLRRGGGRRGGEEQNGGEPAGRPGERAPGPAEPPAPGAGGTGEVEVTRAGEGIQGVGGDTTFLLELAKQPPSLSYNPHGDVAYSGRKE